MCISAGRLVARVRALLQTSLLSDTLSPGPECYSRRSLGSRTGVVVAPFVV